MVLAAVARLQLGVHSYLVQLSGGVRLVASTWHKWLHLEVGGCGANCELYKEYKKCCVPYNMKIQLV